MAVPSYPDEMTAAAWKKVAATNYQKIEDVAGIGGWLTLLERKALDSNETKAFNELEKAVKGGKGGEVVTNYKLVGEALDTVEKLKAVVGEWAKICRKEGATLAGEKETKKCGEWLQKAGPVAVKYCDELLVFGEKLLEDAEKVPTEKITDLDWDLNDWDLSYLLIKSGIKLDSIALPDEKKVMVSVKGKVGAQASKNATLRAEFFDASYAAAKKLVPALKKELEDIDERFSQGVVKGNDIPKLMESAFDGFEKDYAKAADTAIQKVWDEYVKDKEEYRNYKIKTGISIGAKVGGIAVGVVAIGTAGWTGVGTVMGLVALMKNAITLARTLATALQEAHELHDEINDKLEELKKAYADAVSKGLIGAQEVSKDALARLTGIQLTTVTSVKSDIGTYTGKLKGCNVNATKMGADIDRALREADALLVKLKKLKTELAKAKGVSIDKLLDKHNKLMAEVGKLVAAASDFKGDYLKGKQSLVDWQQMLKDLDGEIPDIAKKLQKWAVPLLDFAFVSDGESAITTTGALIREYVIVATDTEDELKEANDVGSLAVDITVLVTGIMGKG